MGISVGSGSSNPGEGTITCCPFIDWTVVQGTWGIVVGSSFSGGYFITTTHNQNDELTRKVYLAAGTYTSTLLTLTGSSYGITTFSLDGVAIHNADCYAAAGANNVILQQTGIVVATSGIYTLSAKVATKNPASSNYGAYYGGYILQRTA